MSYELTMSAHTHKHNREKKKTITNPHPLRACTSMYVIFIILPPFTK